MADKRRRRYSCLRVGMRTGFSRLFCFLWLFAAFPASMLVAQTLQLSSAAASRGTSLVIEISLKSPQGKEPAALQWEATIPTAELNLIDKEIAIGPAAKDAGKSVVCAVKGKTDKALTSVCILAGGQRQIQNGVIAVLMLKVPLNAPIGPARIRVERAIAVSKDVIELPIKPIDTVVSVLGK
jgi:energy-converting hydrogenase Eha subunit A